MITQHEHGPTEVNNHDRRLASFFDYRRNEDLVSLHVYALSVLVERVQTPYHRTITIHSQASRQISFTNTKLFLAEPNVHHGYR